MADNKIVQTIELAGPGRYVLKSDGKWYYQLVTAGIVTSEAVVKKSEVDQAQASTPAQRGAVSPGGGEQNRPANTISNEELANQITQLEALKKNADGTYTWQGKKLTPTAYQNQLASLQNIREERKMAGVFGPEATAQRFNIQQERDKLVQYIANFSQQLEFAKTLVANTTDTTAYTRAQAWVTKLTADQNTLKGFLNTIDSTGKLPPNYVLPPIPTPQQIQTTSPASASGTMTGGRPSAGAANVPSSLISTPSTGPVSAAARGEQRATAPGQPAAPVAGEPAVTLPAGIDFGALAAGATRSTQTPAVTPATTGRPATTTPPAGAGTPATATPATTPIPGGGAVTANGVTLPAGIDFAWLASQTPQTPADWEQAAVELYGGYYEIIKNIPELRGLIGRAMESKWSQDKLQYELEQTTWWKTTTQSARAWEEQKVRDPATLQTQIDARIATIKDSALTLGLRLSDTSLAKLAEDSLKFGWTEQLLNNAVGMEAIKSTGGVSELRQGFYGQAVRSIANQYGVPVSDTFVNQWIAKIATGEENQASYQAYISGLAKNLYPSLAGGLDRGLTFSQMTDPYAQMASNILEIPPGQIDFTDPKWAAAFTMKDAKGQQSQMSYGEWADYLRTTPSFGYEYTDQARNKAYDVVDRLAKMFGAG